ncbi:hypothetical protein EYZ11_008832 [Aspergillus tanneri]|uniref:Uncharacterized protein n=1 Tax=Aspergillus tanneri TaxID=1220188 RepID=A0A4S3JBM2_9EURO|nr:hypothetical protein EYZ11_008832 [Aspergillus tanneri]
MFPYIIGGPPQPLAASIIGNNATATTYKIKCAPGTNSNDCDMGPGGLTLVASPQTTVYKVDGPDPEEVDPGPEENM